MAEEDLKTQIEAAEQAVKDAEESIEKAKAAGIDTTDLEVELAAAKEALEKLKAAYA